MNNARKMIFEAKLNEKSKVKKVYGIMSGKGGVGKSLVTSLLATDMRKKGYNVGIIDADITGPSIPKSFGIKEKIVSNNGEIIPAKSKTGIEIMSVNLLLKNETDPVLWRGPIISNSVKQFWSNVIWDNIDIMFIDMPPGTGDVPLTIFQSIPIDGIIVVTSPQELVSMIVSKSVKMAETMNIPIVGIIENMSYFECPDNGKKYKIFGESNIDKISNQYNLNVLGKLPLDPNIAKTCDKGNIEEIENKWLNNLENTFFKEEVI